jgi:hypothetical protein
LRRRVDFLLVAPQALAAIEVKIVEDQFRSSDRWQVEEYALDLRDFHEFSHGMPSSLYYGVPSKRMPRYRRGESQTSEYERHLMDKFEGG